MQFTFENSYSTFFISIFLSCICTISYGQISYSGEYKKELWKVIDPTNPSPFTSPRTYDEKNEKSTLNNKYIDAYINTKYNSGALLENILKDKYKINPRLTIYNGKEPLNKMPRGSTAVVFMGGHFMFVPTGGKIVTPSGINLSGYNPKKLSENSKNIIRNVFGLEVED